MSDFSVSFTDAEFRQWLAFISTGAPMRAGLRAGALVFKGFMSVYPSVRRQPQPFVSDSQRRGFFAKLNAGEIEVPYQRGTSPGSETAGKRWAVSERDDGNTQVVGNNASYAPLLYAPDKQALYHKGNWQTTEQVWKQRADDVKEAIFNATVQVMRQGRE